MLSSVLPPLDNTPVGQHPYIIRLLKGVFNSRPPKVRLLPEWDLLKVLRALEKSPFEPMLKVPLKFVAWKTAFLIALTTFRRCSDLQSLQLGEGRVNIQKKGVTFVRQGLSKQDRPNHFGKKIFIPKFEGNKLLDPNRALCKYLKRTEEFRQSEDGDITKLFLAVNKPHKPVTTQTISSWIVNMIRCAYQDSNKTVKAHSTRAIGPSWALFNGASLKDILDAADWSKETTFTRFYMREIVPSALDKGTVE